MRQKLDHESPMHNFLRRRHGASHRNKILISLTKYLVSDADTVSFLATAMSSTLRYFFCGLLLLLCGWQSAFAVVVSDGPVVEATENSAIIRWSTDVECGTSAKVGLSQEALLRKAEGSMGTKHEVQVNQLLPGTRYYFSIGTSKKSLQNGNFLTKGTPTRDTKKAEEAKKVDNKPAAPPVKPPVAKPLPPAAKPVYTPPPTSKSWGDSYSLQDHFNRHGKDFNANNPDDYAAKAWLFLQRAIDEGLPAKLDSSDGTIRVWDARSRSFAAYNRNFSTKTYFKPNSGDYFTRQPGKPVKLHRPDPKS